MKGLIETDVKSNWAAKAPTIDEIKILIIMTGHSFYGQRFALIIIIKNLISSIADLSCPI